MKQPKRDPMMDYICALLIRNSSQPVRLTAKELADARKRNFSIAFHKDCVQLALLGEPKNILPGKRP